MMAIWCILLSLIIAIKVRKITLGLSGPFYPYNNKTYFCRPHPLMKAFYQKYRPHYADNLKLAIPVVITSAGHMLTQVSDSVLVGHFVGTIALAGVSLANNVFIIVMVIGMGIAYGITPLI